MQLALSKLKCFEQITSFNKPCTFASLNIFLLHLSVKILHSPRDGWYFTHNWILHKYLVNKISIYISDCPFVIIYIYFYIFSILV